MLLGLLEHGGVGGMSIDVITIFDLPEHPIVSEDPELTDAEAIARDWMALSGDWPI